MPSGRSVDSKMNAGSDICCREYADDHQRRRRRRRPRGGGGGATTTMMSLRRMLLVTFLAIAGSSSLASSQQVYNIHIKDAESSYTKPKPTPVGNGNHAFDGSSITVMTVTTPQQRPTTLLRPPPAAATTIENEHTSPTTMTSISMKGPTISIKASMEDNQSSESQQITRPKTTAEKVEESFMSNFVTLGGSNTTPPKEEQQQQQQESPGITVQLGAFSTIKEQQPDNAITVQLGDDSSTEDPSATITIASVTKIEQETSNTSSEGGGGVNDTDCIDGVLYVCSIQKWCSLPDFEVKVGKYWTMVWVEHGSCSESDSEGGDPAEDESDSNSSESLVVPSDDAPCPDEKWEEGSYAAEDRIHAGGQSFKCKGHPFTPWCGMRGYEPIVDSYWSMAWDVEGDCSTMSPSPRPTKSEASPSIYQPTTETNLIIVIETPTTPGPTPPKTAVAPKPTGTPKPRPVPVTTRQPTISTSTATRPVPPTAQPTLEEEPAITSPSSSTEIAKDGSTTEKVYDILEQKKSRIDSELFLYDTGFGVVESSVYRYQGFRDGLEVMHEEGVGDSFFYLGDSSDIGYKIGLVNVAAFIAQSMKETIKYDACDENSWDLVNGKYPLSNACGQLGQSYQDYHCPENEKHMECKVDPNMKITATTHAKWYGAPAPMFCGSKKEYPFTGYWNYGLECNLAWVDPPKTCDVYEGQKAGGFDNTSPVANNSGRTDVEGCCWWGRGVIQTTGICNFGKLNYFLGARAKQEGRKSRYPSIDFCKTPDAICNSEEHQELKWVAGYFYWINALQSYSVGDWDYITELHKFVENGMEGDAFINAVSGIVNRGCHNPPCGTGALDGGPERADNFRKVLAVFFE